MKAIVIEEYGSPDVLQLKEVERPAPKEGEVLIKIHAAGTNAADWRLMRADPFFIRLNSGLRKPKTPILGADIAGRVETLGPGASRFQVGDAVYGELSDSGLGGFAEYVCAPENILALMPANLSFEKAAAVPMAAVTALQGLRDVGGIQEGQKVLIHGASGGVGTFAVQIAKAYGTEVTAVCSTSKIETARKLGADHVIDYKKEDFSKSGQQYDLILIANGDRPLSDYEQALAPAGTMVVSGFSMRQLFGAMLLGSLKSRSGGKSIRALSAKANRADLESVTAWIENGKVTPVVDRCYPLSEVPEAIRYLEGGHADGKVVISMESQKKS